MSGLPIIQKKRKRNIKQKQTITTVTNIYLNKCRKAFYATSQSLKNEGTKKVFWSLVNSPNFLLILFLYQRNVRFTFVFTFSEEIFFTQ